MWWPRRRSTKGQTMYIPGKVFVVTGGGNGIGRAVVLDLVARGAKGVAAVDVDRDGLAETAALAGSAAVSTHVVEDRKSTRLNSSHVASSYAVFCLKKKNKTK